MTRGRTRSIRQEINHCNGMMGRVINYTTDVSDEDYVVLLNLFIVHLKCYCVFSSLHTDVMSWLIDAKCVQVTVDWEAMSI